MLNIDSIWRGSVQQKIFRCLLECFSFPGDVVSLNPYLGSDSALVTVLATLLDQSVSWSDEDELICSDDRMLLQCSQKVPEEAEFVIKDGNQKPRDHFAVNLGDLTNPEQGATLILVGENITLGSLVLRLTGVGIDGAKTLNLEGFDPMWFELRNYWNRDFPLGVDLILVDAKKVVALPRTTNIIIGGV